VLAALWPHLPKTAGATEKVTRDGERRRPAARRPRLLDLHGLADHAALHRGVRWFVFEQELSLSRDQLRAFAALFKMNTRGLQDAHGRRIEANE
jgi:carbonic anhydrase